MKATKTDNMIIHPDSRVRLKQMGSIFEIRMTARQPEIKIKRLNKDEYIDLRTGAVETFSNDAKLRVHNISTLRRTMADLKSIINTNTEFPSRCKHIVLTYKKVQSDPAELYEDHRRFFQRVRYYHKKRGLPVPEYISVIEPQSRQSFHVHSVWVYPKKAPYISNDDLYSLWQEKGYTKIRAIKGDDIGAYLVSYLCDLPFEEAMQNGITDIDNVKVIEETDKAGNKRSKGFVKGARLKLFPSNFKIYRVSRNIKRPVVYDDITEAEAQKIIGSASLTYEKTITITSDDGKEYFNTIGYRYYNRKRGASNGKAINQSTTKPEGT